MVSLFLHVKKKLATLATCLPILNAVMSHNLDPDFSYPLFD